MDTIFALATPPGKSGVAVIRISGPASKTVLEALCKAPAPAPRVAMLATLYDSDGHVIDKALVMYFAAPHSFTGQEVVELHSHGSRAVLKEIYAALAAQQGLRVAEPGEFTRRAFLNGKMDLTAAEGIADLIDAETTAQKKQALRHMQGDAARFFEELRSGIIHALAFLEAYIDFPDEDIPDSVHQEISDAIQNINKRITGQLAGSKAARNIRDGIFITILGPPNVGKSSLMNHLAGRDVAIVSPTPGTTRDVIEVRLQIAGYCVILSDTAGIRDEAGDIEAEGIRRSHLRAKDADIKIVMVDKDSLHAKNAEALVDADTLLVINKADLPLPARLPVIKGVAAMEVSVKTGQGIDTLLAALENRISEFNQAEPSFATQVRHQHLLEEAQKHLVRFSEVNDSGIELQCEELRRAATEIGKITGKIEVDELLGHIFASFCIGK